MRAPGRTLKSANKEKSHLPGRGIWRMPPSFLASPKCVQLGIFQEETEPHRLLLEDF